MIPTERNPKADQAQGIVQSASTAGAPDDWHCDLDGARLEEEAETIHGDTTFSVRRCSADPGHHKLVPV